MPRRQRPSTLRLCFFHQNCRILEEQTDFSYDASAGRQRESPSTKYDS